jgi:hypothetical protein
MDWVITTAEEHDTDFYLRKFSWTAIVRHRMVAGAASPDDPTLTDYWATRRRRSKPPVGKTTLRLLQAQRWRRSICRGLLLHDDHEPQSPQQWEQWLTAPAKRSANTRSPHGMLARRTNASQTVSYTPTASAESSATAAGTTPLPAYEPSGLA